MLAETGQICLILALMLSFLQAVTGLLGARSDEWRLMAFSERSAIAQMIFCVLAFGCLAASFVNSDFSVRLVALHSHTTKPLIYKFSGTWANHEGSMLLWVMLIAIFGAMMVMFGRSLPASLRVRAVAIQGLIGAGFGAFLLFTSNPFSRLSPVPLNGQGLNPLLQDPGLAFHPPFLYLGYVGFSVAFAFAVAALIERRVDAMWARWIQPWVLLAWSFLTIGITMGSIWAYYELGWGGWWFWDPVENVSFMPWLAGTALLHSTIVVQSRSSFIRWTLLLAIVTFSLSLVGTFIVRSGILTSVHSFAVDPSRGVFLLGLLVLATGGALWLYYLRADDIEYGAPFDPVSREGGLVLNNLLLICAIVTVFLGTFYPLIMDAVSGQKITVGPPYYNLLFAPIMSLLILVMAVGPSLKWGQDSLSQIRALLLKILAVTVVISLMTLVIGKNIIGALGVGLAAWLATGTLLAYANKMRIGCAKSTPGNLWLRWRLLPASTHGFVLAHLGMAVTVAGITIMSTWSIETDDRLKIGDSLAVGDYSFYLERAERVRGPNYFATQLHLQIKDENGREQADLVVEGRQYPVEGTETSEGALDVTPLRTLYAALGEGDRDRGWVIRGYYHPFVSWIWSGALIMAFGGFVSLADRRFGFVRLKSSWIAARSLQAE